MYDTSEFKKGLRIELDGHPYIMTENQFVKPGKGQAFNRVKVKSLLNGNVIERTFKSGEKVSKADVVDVTMQYLYMADGVYHFMDKKTYEQIEVKKEQLGDTWKWLEEESEVSIVLYKQQPVSVTLPNFSNLKITFCEPGVKGDTATGATKPATLSTGAIIQVPLFVNEGEIIKVDTRTGEYTERVKE